MTTRTPSARRWARIGGAGLRAGAMALLVALPPLVLGEGSEAGGQLVALFALLLFAFTAAEYAAANPSLVEFREAPPYNRLRALALGGSLLGASLVLREGEGGTGAGTAELLLRALAARLGEALDRPLSPVRLLAASLAQGEPGRAASLGAAAGVAYAVSLLVAGGFALALRLRGWPSARSFNLWVNLPQFDPTAARDVVGRLQAEANLNLSLGVLLPWVLPVAVRLAPLEGSALAEPTAIAWTVTAWAFLPASLLMRGAALHRVAGMIAAQRRRAGGEGALQPA